jgi:hypothetical protein
MTAPPNMDVRHQALEAFNDIIGVDGTNRIIRIVQRGRDPQTARFTFTLADGRDIRIGTIDTLWSQIQLGKVVAVTMSASLIPVEPKDWRIAIAMIVRHAIDVTEPDGENYEDTVLDWLTRYTPYATTDRDGAASSGSPFLEAGEIWISATNFAKHIRREYTEQVKLPELRQALADLGFTRKTINYVRGAGHTSTRSTASYYHAPIGAIQPESGAE